MLRPARASSMMRRRYSGAYGECVRGIGNLLFYFSPNTVHQSGSTPLLRAMPSIIGSVSCSTGSHQPALVCFASALFALFLIGGSFPPRGRGSFATPLLRPAWSRRYLFKFQHALGHRQIVCAWTERLTVPDSPE